MLWPDISESNGPAQQGGEARTGDMPGLFPSGISGNEQFCSRRGHICVEKLQPGEPPVRVASRANSLHNFLTRVAAFFVADMRYFKRGFVVNIFVVVICAGP